MGLAGPIVLLTIGGLMIASALKGVSIPDLLAGKSGDTLNPHGGSTAPVGGAVDPTAAVSGSGGPIVGGNWTAPAGGAHGFKGPQAALLNTLAGVAQNHFGLTITATTNGTHVPGSYHYEDEAFDASGAESDMRAFAQYVQDNYGSQISELIHNPGFAIKDGRNVTGSVVYAAVWAGHRDHVHVAAAGTANVGSQGAGFGPAPGTLGPSFP